MSKVQMLKLFISEQVTTAVEKIFDKFLTTIEDYEKELSRSREENERRRKLLEALSNPQLQLHGTDGGGVSQLITAQGGRHGVILPETQQPLDRKEDVPSVQEGKSSSPDQQDPEPPHIKEEQQELGTNQEGEKLQELVIVDISSSHVPVKNQRQSEENREAEPPVNILIEEFETESDGEDCGGLEPLMDFHPDRHLQPDTDEKTLVSVQSSSLTSVSEIREPQSDINSLETKEIVVSDVKFNTDNNSFICSQCGEKFASEESLQGHMTFTHQTDHMGVHAGETELSCQVCGQRFALRIQLRRHKCVGKSSQLNGGGTKRKSRRGEATNACNSFSCPKCNKSFDDFYPFEKHLRSHIKEKRFSCPFCGKGFASRDDMIIHMRMHTGEKPFSCRFCYKRFTWSSQVKNHTCSREKCFKLYQRPIEEDMEAETPASISTEQMEKEDDGEDYAGLEPYSDTHLQPDTADTSPEYGRDGDDCTKIGEPQTDLKCQKRKRKPFSCSICGQQFSSTTALQSHALLHFKRKIFNCGHCDKTFSCYTELLTHKNNPEPYPVTHLQSENEDKISNSSDTDVSDGEWTETRGSQSDLKSLKTEAIHVSDIKSNAVNKPYACCLCGRKFVSKIKCRRHKTVCHKRINIFSCPLCCEAFTRKSSMHLHMAVHAKMKQFRCRHCEKIFKSLNGVKRHKCVRKSSQQKHEARKPASDAVCNKLTPKKYKKFSCKNCDDTFGNFSALVRRRKTHLEKVCPICDRIISNMMALTKHISTHTGEKSFSCPHCYKMFNRHSKLKNHKCNRRKYNRRRQKSDEVKRKIVYRCYICCKKLLKSAFKNHVKLHFTTNIFNCGHCDKTFSCYDEFTRHKNKKHPERNEVLTKKLEYVEQYICPDCGKILSSQATLDCHMEAIKRKTYSCQFCSAVFCNDLDYIRHKKFHGIEKPFKCDQCDRCFTFLSGLESHMVWHSTERLTDCPLCPRQFKDSGSVRQHLRVHLPDKKPFICPFCKRAHTTRKRWLLHMKTYIGQKPADLKSE